MQSEDCLNCYYWDYVDDTSESNAKICYYSVEASPEHPAACLSEDIEIYRTTNKELVEKSMKEINNDWSSYFQDCFADIFNFLSAGKYSDKK